MATSWDPRNPQIQGTSGKIPQILYDAYGANSQSFKAGQFVYANAGAITVSADGDVASSGTGITDTI